MSGVMSDDVRRRFAEKHKATEGRGEAAKGRKSDNLGVARDNAQFAAVADLWLGRARASPVAISEPFLTGTKQPPPPILAVPEKGP